MKDKPKIAYCFMLYDALKHGQVWKKFFEQDKSNSHTIYSHIKKTGPKTQPLMRKYKIKPIKTDYCDVSLVYAWILLLQHALKDPKNQYFAILSGECIPLYPYTQVYKKITRSKKSRINVEYDVEPAEETGLYWADQWCILNRRQAELLVKLKTTVKGKKFARSILGQIEDFCSDEMLPINWFVEHYGPPSSKKFRKEIMLVPTTYTYWDGVHTSPKKFNSPQMKKMRKSICSSRAIFGRKFNAKAARELSMTC